MDATDKRNHTRRENCEKPITGGEQTAHADSGSKRYLWTEEHIKKATNYVELAQGDVFPNLDDIELA